ncbi:MULTISPECIES: hypothetical protein [unclassified Mesorhizobium]|uniref:hypothetical protein n=1 Tax=unclassified Mesorhizobium TaxID=325217 RepID=UPI00333D27F4
MRVLRGLTDEWVDVPDGADPVVRGKVVFLGLVNAGLADMRQAPAGLVDLSAGPAPAIRWQRKITSAGRAARGVTSWKAKSMDPSL